MKRISLWFSSSHALATILLVTTASSAFAQTPTPTPDSRGLGIQSGSATGNSQNTQKAREAKPELVLQTGYNNLFGATRLVFSPDGRLLATTTFRSSTIKLWETATGRELRNLSSGSQSAMGMAPFVAFSRDSKLVAAATGDNAVKIWDVTSGRELQTLAGSQSSVLASLGVYFIAFTANGKIVTISDAIKVWNVATGRELRKMETSTLNTGDISGFATGGGGAALSQDGNQLASVITDGDKALVKFWDLTSGQESGSVNLTNKEVNSADLAFASDGRLLVSGIVDKHLKLWDVTKDGNKANERELGTTAKDYSLVEFSRDGRLVALSEAYAIKIWEVATAHEMPGFKVPNNGLVSTQVEAFASFSDDGKKVATGGFDTPTILWDTETGKQILKMNGRTNMAYKVSFSADGSRLSSGGRTRWDLGTGRGLRVTAGPSDKGFGVPSPDGRLLAVFTLNSNAVSILETPSGRQLQNLVPAAGGGVVQRASFSPDGTMLVTTYSANQEQRKTGAVGTQPGSNENQVKIWDVKSGRELRALVLGNNPSEVSFSADGRVIATLGAQGEVALWDTGSGSRLRDLTASPLGSFGQIMNGSMNPGVNSGKPPKPGKQGSPGSMPNIGNIPNMPNMGSLGMPGGLPQMPSIADMSAMMTNVLGSMSAGTMGRSVTSLAFSPDGRTLATGGVESKSNLDQMMGGMGQQKSRNSNKPPDTQDLMKDIKIESIGRVVLWDTTTGQQIGELKGHGKGVTQVAFSRDGRLLASSSSDNTIKIWDVAMRRELHTLTGHTSNIDSIDFSPDARLLASASDDGGTFLWDANTGEHLLTSSRSTMAANGW